MAEARRPHSPGACRRAFTGEQSALARDLGVRWPSCLSRPRDARGDLSSQRLPVMPSEREGFGLPLLESLACGTPVVASDIAALREVGGEAVTYCAVGDVEAWTNAIRALLDERERRPAEWAARQERGVQRADALAGRNTPAKSRRCTRASRTGRPSRAESAARREILSAAFRGHGAHRRDALPRDTWPVRQPGARVRRVRSTKKEVVDGIQVTRVGTLGQAGSVPIAPASPRIWAEPTRM